MLLFDFFARIQFHNGGSLKAEIPHMGRTMGGDGERGERVTWGVSLSFIPISKLKIV